MMGDCDGPLLDMAHVYTLLEGDTALIRELCAVFLVTWRPHMALLRHAVRVRDGGEFFRLAHGLRGSLTFLSPAGAALTAATLEGMASRADFTRAETLCDRLQAQLEALQDAMQILVQVGQDRLESA